MNVFETIIDRRNTRKFQDKPVDDKMVGVILYMASQANSAGNVQEWGFIVVKDEDVKKQLYEAALKQEHVLEAPLDIVVCADLKKISLKYGKRGEILYSMQDTAFAIENMLLAAHALGLGSNVVQAFDEDKVKTILELPEYIRPIVIVTIGYPKGVQEKNDRIPFENLTWVNKWGEKYMISYRTQPGNSVETRPLGNIIEDALKKRIKKKSGEKPTTFSEILKKLTK